jgi:glycosyltransferase involved in cell wall biosynthesis
VLTRPDWIDFKPLPRPGDIPVRELPLSRRFLSACERWETMRQYLEARAPCVYFPNHDFSHSCISPALSARVAICGIAHSDDPQHYEHVGRLGQYWNSVVAVSAAIGARIERQFPSLAPRLSVIPYGVSMPPSPCVRQPVHRALRAVYAGRLDQSQKRVLDLPAVMRAAALLGVHVELTVAGGGPEEEALQRAFRDAGQSARVRFVGILGADRMGDVYAEHDVFLLTSAFEGLPLGLLEAMGRGCVPLVTDLRSGVPEVIQHGVNGFVCEAGDAAGYARHLRTLHDAPGVRVEMALRAWETVYSRFRLETMTDRYVSLCERLLSDGFVRPPGTIEPSPFAPRAELLPGPVQMLGHYANDLSRVLRR